MGYQKPANAALERKVNGEKWGERLHGGYIGKDVYQGTMSQRVILATGLREMRNFMARTKSIGGEWGGFNQIANFGCTPPSQCQQYR